MSKYTAILIYVFSGMITGFSQLLLKLAANGSKKDDIGMKQLFDWRIICSYAMLMGTVVLNMFAMRYIPYKYVPVLSTTSYIFVLLLSWIVLHEKLYRKQLCGMIMIVVGLVIFNLL